MAFLHRFSDLTPGVKYRVSITTAIPGVPEDSTVDIGDFVVRMYNYIYCRKEIYKNITLLLLLNSPTVGATATSKNSLVFCKNNVIKTLVSFLLKLLKKN